MTAFARNHSGVAPLIGERRMSSGGRKQSGRNGTPLRVQVRMSCRVLVALIACFACGSLPNVGNPGATTESAPRSSSPSAAASAAQIVPPDPTQLTAKNCASGPLTTADRNLGNFNMRPAPNWTEDTTEYFRESLRLDLVAPDLYGYAPTRIRFWSLPGEVHVIYGSNATAHSIAVQHAAAPEFSSPLSVGTTVSDCSIAGEPAAGFGYAQGNERGYRFSVVHKDLLYEIWLFGAGGVGNLAGQDALGMMGSIAWLS
jgi:hypothetical protein